MSKKAEACRVCLDSKQSKHRSLYDKYKSYVLYEFINTLTNLKIKLNDGFPDKICNSCYLQLKSSINLKEKCEASDLILRSKSVKVEIFTETHNIPVKSEDSFENNVKVEHYSDDNIDDTLACDIEQECFKNSDSDDDKQSKQNVIKKENSNETCFAYPVQYIDALNVALKNNIKKRLLDLKLECHDCGEIFKSKCKLKVHWKKTHMLPSLICIQCKRMFKSYKAFHLHRKKKSRSCAIASDSNVIIEGIGKSRIFCCKECNYKSKRVKDMSAHLVIHSGDRPFQCNLCQKTYTQLSSLQGHQETAHQKYIVEMTCHYCGKFVKGRRKVHRHLRSHTRVQCNVCNKSISKLGFPVHMKRHSGVKSYACEKCVSTFYTISELCNHKRLVHSKKSFKCDLCEYTTVKENCLKNHRNKHSDKNLPCTVCGRFFLSSEKLAMHQKTHFAEKKFSCPQCDTRFYKRDSVRRHLKLKHFVENSEPQSEPTVPPVVKTEVVCLPKPEGAE